MKLGALVWPQYTDWASLVETGTVVDRAGFDTLWTWDHLYPIVGDADGPMFEGYLTLAAWAEHTERVRLGLEARKVAEAMKERNTGWRGPQDGPFGPAELVAE